jgi:hypothetical protein
VHDQRPDTSFHDVSAEHRHDSAPRAGRAADGVDNRAEVTRYKNVGKRAKEISERGVRTGKTRELFG